MALHRKLKLGLKHIAGGRLLSFQNFDLYAPYSRGPNREKTDHAVHATKVVFPMLAEFAERQGRTLLPLISAEVFGQETHATAMQLKKLLDEQGSDKASKHNYHLVLGRILHERARFKAVLEIGLGSNNPRILSNMTVRRRPGASVRAFRDFLPNAQIYGADYDRGALFQDDRISTFFVDQTDPKTLQSLAALLPDALDLIIDDGLHSPTANLATLDFALPLLAEGGWIVIEDINPLTLPIWQVVGQLLAPEFEAHIIECTKNPIFAVERTTRATVSK